MSKKAKEKKNISRSLLMDEVGSNSITKSIIVFVLVLFTAFLIWANYVPLSEVISAEGEVLGVDNSVLVQHSYGGQIIDVFVKDQQLVKAGDPILRLDDSFINLKIEKNLNKKRFLLSQITILSEEVKIADILYKQQLYPASEYLNLKRKKLDLENQLKEVQYDLEQNYLNKEGLTLKAPTSGFIHGLHIRGINSVLNAGSNICYIIPSDAHYYARIKIPGNYIGSVRRGLNVTLKFAAYNYSQYGGMEAKLESLSASTFNDSSGSYYQGNVLLPNKFLMDDQNLPILQGMNVSAEIIIGEKTLFEYLFIPVKASFKSAFNEP